MRRELCCLAVGILAMLVPRSVAAYCRASTCDPDGARCFPSQGNDCGRALYWKRNCVGIAVQKDASNQVSYPDAKAVVRASFSAWEETPCDQGPPGIHVEILNKVDCANVEYNEHGGNVNVVVFRDGGWPHPQGSHNVALTTVTFDKGTGEIYDADIEVNSDGYPLSLGEPVEFDLLSVLTHEAGHFLGMAHWPDPTATMYANYSHGQTEFRTLSPDDQAGICEIYPPDDGPAAECNPIPRHGYSPACAEAQTEGTCTAAPAIPGGGDGTRAAWLFALLAALAPMRRRSKVD